MLSARRTTENFGLQRAVEWAAALNKPLLILDILFLDLPRISERLHSFLLSGMRDIANNLSERCARYFPFVERAKGEGFALLSELMKRACVVVTDDFPQRWEQQQANGAAKKCPVRFKLIDCNGLLPLRAAEQVFPTAYAFRRFLQKNLPDHLGNSPAHDPLARVDLPSCRLPKTITERWPEASLGTNPISSQIAGGSKQAEKALKNFLAHKLDRYLDERNEPESDVTSGLSPYLHSGQISAHRIFSQIMRREKWNTDNLSSKTSGKREGWWGCSPSAEAFLDQLVTWRELGYNFCAQRDDYDRFDSLPVWAQRTLKEHAADIRPYVYTRAQLESAATHDPLWNAAQTQLVRDGTIHNYLRMLWGKKILEWTRAPAEAAEIMIEFNDTYALDGRDPNSYSGIFWVLGRYDRPWAPERPIFGTIRFMSSANTARKIRVRDYIRRYSG